jgi:hypothetical protein
MSNMIDQYIDCCIINGSHYDVSQAAVEILKNILKYIGNNTWQYKNEMGIWVNDEKQNMLKYELKTRVCNAFIERSLFWHNKGSEENIDINISIDCKFRANKLLNISSKLKDDKYISTIIKETKQFFDIE